MKSLVVRAAGSDPAAEVIVKRLVVRAVAAIPMLGALALLATVAVEPLPTIGIGCALLAYLWCWQRLETGMGWSRHSLARSVLPYSVAFAMLMVAVALASRSVIDQPGVALVVALAGMAAAIGAVALAVHAARPSP